MISVVTGTLNRGHCLQTLIDNTVNANENLELVLVDGGEIGNGSSKFIKDLNHPRIKLIEVGERSSYSHFMNLGIEHSTFEWVCQWNDDVVLVNDWNEVIKELESDDDFYLFNWKYGTLAQINDEDWLSGKDHAHPNGGWCIVDEWETIKQVVMNYGIYNKRVFRQIGMYNSDYLYYWCDSDMSIRAQIFGFKKKGLPHIKVCSYEGNKVAINNWNEEGKYHKYFEQYSKGIIDFDYIKLLK